MIDYIKLLNENNLNLGIIAIVLVIIFTLLFISIICYIFIVQEEILEIIFCFRFVCRILLCTFRNWYKRKYCQSGKI